MKSTWKVCLMAALLLAAVNAKATVLFSDNYNRANSNDIDAAADGMAGTVSPLTYVESFEGSGQPTSIAIVNNQLNVAMGPGMGSLFVDRNFNDADILSAGGFSISLDVASITNADDIGNRYGGFGVGNTRDEALNAKDSFDTTTAYRPNLARANMGYGVSDFYVDLALDKKLRVWSNGALLNTIDVGVAAGTIKADFVLSSFDAGSLVTAAVYFNGVLKDTQTFDWDFTGANYIGISGRTAAAGVFLDNLEIATIPEPATLVLLGLGMLTLRNRK